MHRKLAKRATFSHGAQFTYLTAAGQRLRFLHSGTTNYLYWRGEYEPDTTGLFCELAKSASVVLDIGSADGLYAVLAAAANPRARVIAFEPGVAAARICQANIELNAPLTNNVELQVVALGDVDAQTTFYVAGESGGNSSLDAKFRATHREQPVTLRRGDAVLDELGIANVDLIKIDTESTEPAVLRGLVRHLETSRPTIICEVLAGRTERELEAVLGGLGYRYEWITSDGLEPRSEIVGDHQYRHPNYLFTARHQRS